MIFFLSVFVFGIISAILCNNVKRTYNFVGGGLATLIVIASYFRPKSNFPDYPYYLGAISTLVDIELPHSFGLDYIFYEIGFWSFTLFLKSILKSPELVLIIPVFLNTLILIISSSLIFRQLRKGLNLSQNYKFVSYNLVFFIILYYSYYGFYYNFIVVRAGLALALLTLSIAFYFRSLFLLSLFFLAVSLFFHSTAFVGLLTYSLLFLKPISPKFHYRFWFFSFLVILFNIDNAIASYDWTAIFQLSDIKSESFYGSYLSASYENQSSEFSLFSVFILVIWYFVIRFRVESEVYMKLLNIYSIGNLIYLTGSSITTFSRVTDWLNYIGVITLFISIINIKSSKLRYVFFFFIVLIYNLFLLRVINFF